MNKFLNFSNLFITGIQEGLITLSEELAAGKLVKNLTLFPALQITLGGFQLLDLIITELKSHMTCSRSLIGGNFICQIKILYKFSSLNAVISTNERHVTFKLRYNQI